MGGGCFNVERVRNRGNGYLGEGSYTMHLWRVFSSDGVGNSRLGKW